ncbi:MAG: hypothetical protein NC132_06120 [Corallococcus sp.]|nr:hypothetical protein [Corallococcus sp.]MCM1360105.1 hypothetical protein [Corallococcus sp.]MCM1395662.1 hypothetical protein [Corallococcus sp.]
MKKTKTETAPLAEKIKKPIKKIKRATPFKKQQPQNLAPEKLTLLVTVVNREKADYFLDFIQSFQSNMQLDLSAFGTAQRALGLLTPDTEKAVLFSVLTKTNVKSALSALEQKFKTIRGGKGVAFTVPMTSTIGVLIYRFLANKE